MDDYQFFMLLAVIMYGIHRMTKDDDLVSFVWIFSIISFLNSPTINKIISIFT